MATCDPFADLSNGAVFPKDVVEFVRGNFVRQVADKQNAVAFRRQSVLFNYFTFAPLREAIRYK